jgi:hypothetical protein
MSDWEIVQDNEIQHPSEQSDWEVLDNNIPKSQESFGQALYYAPKRILEDVVNLGRRAYNAIPGYYEKSKEEIPGIFTEFYKHPGHSAMQGLAGLNEAINSLSQFPLNVSKYGSERLNLTPQALTNAIQKITPEDTTNAISQLFEEPKYSGEAALRGAFRNIPSLYGASKLAASIKPTGLLTTEKSLKNSVLKMHDTLESRANKAFNEVSSEVEKRNLPHVNIDPYMIDDLRGYFPKTKSANTLLDEAKKGSYNALRKLQTDLYTKGKKNLGSSLETDRMRGAEMLEKRNDINESISNYLKDTGNMDLYDTLNKARSDWATLQKIYYNKKMNKSIVNMVNKDFRKTPKNLSNILLEESNPMKSLKDFHPGLENNLNKFLMKKNALSQLKKIIFPAALGITGYEIGKSNRQ